jgi:hypothetical protein
VADDETSGTDKKKKPGLLRRAAGKTVGIALAGTGTVGKMLGDKIAGKQSGPTGTRRAAPGITRRVAGAVTGIALAGTGSFGRYAAAKVRGNNTTTRSSKVPGTGKKGAKPEAPRESDPEIQEMATRVADDINSVRQDMDEGMRFLYGEIKNVDRRVTDLSRQMSKPDSDASSKRLGQQIRDSKGRYTGQYADPVTNIPPVNQTNKSRNAPQKPSLIDNLRAAAGTAGTVAAEMGGAAAIANAAKATKAYNAARLGTRLGRGVAGIGSAIAGGMEYMDSGDWKRSLAVGAGSLVGGAVGTMAGAGAGALLGPVGASVGGIGGAVLGSGYGEDLGRSAYDYITGYKPGAKDAKKATGKTPDLDEAIEIDMKKNISFTTTADIKMKAANITLEALKINFKTSQLLINGQPFTGMGTGSSTPKRSAFEQDRYDELVKKHGVDKATELEDIQNNPFMGSIRSLERQAGVLGSLPSGGNASDGSTGPIPSTTDMDKKDAAWFSRKSGSRASGSFRPGQDPAPGVETSGERAGLNKNSKLEDYDGTHTREALGVDARQYNAFREAIAKTESSGGKYDLKGGSSNRFSGAYQFGAAEIAETAAKLGEQPPSREQFLADKKMQERYMDRYTKSHHDYLIKNSPEYQKMGAEERLGVLGYAHNQGAGGAAKWLSSGQAGSDAFGTSGTKYTKDIASQLARTKDDPNTAVAKKDKMPNTGWAKMMETSGGLDDKQLKLPDAKPKNVVEATMNEVERQYKNTGKINLKDPETGEILGKYSFVTGGGGKGSIPNTNMQLNQYWPNDDSLGHRWTLSENGNKTDSAQDPGIPGVSGPSERSEFRIHQAHGAGTLGCVGILGGDKVYADFEKNLLYVQSKTKGPVTLRVGTPEAIAAMNKMDTNGPGVTQRLTPSQREQLTEKATENPSWVDSASKNIGDSNGFDSAASTTADATDLTPSMLGANELDAELAKPKPTPIDLASQLGTGDLDKQAASSDAKIVQQIPTPPNLDQNTDPNAGQKLADNIKGETQSTPAKTDEIASAKRAAPDNRGASDSRGSLRSPTNNPEAEAPSPGSDGYGDCVSNPDGGGLCSV